MRPHPVFFVFLLAAAAALAGCRKQPEAGLPTADPSHLHHAGDDGVVESVDTTAEGFGGSAGEAVTDAIRLAIFQVNGGSIQSLRVSARYGPDLTLGQDSASLRTESFAELVRQRADGVIRNFRVKELQAPSTADGDRYRATVEAAIVRFAPSADRQMVKVAIGAIRFDTASLAMGDRSIASAEVAENLRRRIGSELMKTGLFAVLDRDSEADIAWSGRASAFAYHRHERQLAAREHELVRYSGVWALSEKLVSVASRQVIVADWLRGTATSTRPTMQLQEIDGDQVLQDMSTDLVDKVVASILQRTFPAAVVSRHGTSVVLSQGGQKLKSGGLYAVVVMGAEIKDPQTGRILGRVETPCCELRVERVTSNLGYGRLENVRTALEHLPLAGLQMRHEIRRGARSASPAEPVAQAPAIMADDKW